jgi:hypothetical protein
MRSRVSSLSLITDRPVGLYAITKFQNCQVCWLCRNPLGKKLETTKRLLGLFLTMPLLLPEPWRPGVVGGTEVSFDTTVEFVHSPRDSNWKASF